MKIPVEHWKRTEAGFWCTDCGKEVPPEGFESAEFVNHFWLSSLVKSV